MPVSLPGLPKPFIFDPNPNKFATIFFSYSPVV
jgi:hypothetical protein